MNREEANIDQYTYEHLPQAVALLDSDEWLQLFHPPVYPSEYEEIQKLRLAVSTVLTALSGPQPDPITGLVPCGCGGKLVLHKCSDREFMTTFYVECDNEECRLSVGRRYDPINHCRRGEFTDTKSAIEASNRAMGYIPMELSTPLPEVEEQEPWPGDDLDCPNCGAMLELLEGGMLACRLCGFADNDTAEVEG